MTSELIPVRQRDDELIDLPGLARTFGRYKWSILALTILTGAIAALVAFSLRPMYRGTVTLLIEAQNQRVAQLQDIYDTELPALEFLGAQLAVMQSRELARRTVERLNLSADPEFSDVLAAESRLDLRRYLPFLPETSSLKEPESEDERQNAVINEFMKRITLEPFGRTQVVKVHFDAYSPKLAALAANTIADLFIESGLEARLEATTKASSWLTDKLAEIQQQLAAAEAQLQAFRETEQLVDVGAFGGTRGLSEEEVVDYARRLREAERRRTELQNSYEKVRASGDDGRRLRDVSTLLIDPLVQRASDNFLSAQETVKQLEDRYGAKHPQMTAARARLATAEAAFNEQLRIAARGVKAEYEIALESERALARQLEIARGQIQRLDRKKYELSVLERDVQTNRSLYDAFVTRFKETDVAVSYQTVAARVIDPATEPRIAQSPKKKKIVLLATLCGLIGGILLAILHHLLNEGVTSAEELESIAQLPVLGVLALVSGFTGKKSNLAKYYLDKPHTVFAEGVRSTSAALKLADAEHRLKRIMVTSSVPAEGKSSVSAALALTLGASEKVLLVETDLRRPSLRRLFNVSGQPVGLTEALAGTATIDECLHHVERGSIWILPSGRTPPNPAELLGSAAFAELLAALSTRFDRIILDSPPAQSAADALLIGRQCDGTLFVVKSDTTARRAVRNSLKHLRFASIPIVGIVVNQVDVRRNPHYADSYNYVYGYYG